MESKKLLEERAAIANEMGALTNVVNKEGRAFTAEELERFDRMDADFKALTDRIETAKRVERSAELVIPTKEKPSLTSHRPANVTRQDRELGFKAWALKAAGRDDCLTTRHVEAAHKCQFNLGTDTIRLVLGDGEDVQRNQSSAVNSEGGYLQNDGVFQGLERNLKWFGGARKVAKVIRTDTGEPISYAYSDDTSNLGVRLGQNTTVSNVNVVYQKKTLGEYTYTSGVYPVSVQLLQDARIDVSSDIGEVLGVRLARVTNTDYTTGTGASQPTGFMTDASAGVTASADAFTYADLVGQLFSVDPAYRDDPSFAWTMSDQTMSYIWKLTDSNGRPLIWNQMNNIASGFEFRLLDKPVVINNAMDNQSGGSGKKPIACGAFGKFIIRDVREATVVALRERYMDQLAVGFIAYLRTDCKLLNPNAVKYLLLP